MKKLNNRNYFVVIDQSEEMWTALKFAIKRAKSTKSNITTISFYQNITEEILLAIAAENIINKDQMNIEKQKHKEIHQYIFEKSKIKAKSEIFMLSEIDNFIDFLNNYSSNSTIVLATSKDIGKPGPLIDKLIYEKSNTLHCPLVIINGSLSDQEIEKII